MDRRQFIKTTANIAIGSSIISPVAYTEASATPPVLAEVQNGAVDKMVEKAIDVVGGIETFVKKGDVVVVKPNIGWARRPEQGANTNPVVVAAIVRLCKAAGAKKVRVFDHTCNEARRCYQMSGIEKSAKQAGADVRFMMRQRFKKVAIPNGKLLKSWEFYRDVLDADVFINVPVIKHHSLCKITMGLKNIMGIIGGKRGEIHNKFDEKLIDLNLVIKPNLTILDGTRILLHNGPVGGNLDDVVEKNTIIAGTDPVASDALGAQLFGLQADSLTYLVNAHKRGLGEIDPANMKIERINLAG